MTPQPQAPTPAREPLRLMVVVAHPHDFTHCAGTCGIHRSLGDAVTVVTLTNGATKHVDISEWAEKRVEAETLFATQGHTEAFARKRIEISAGRAGWNCGTQYAEGFVRSAPDLFDQLPVPDRALQKARGKRMDHLLRISGELPGPSKA